MLYDHTATHQARSADLMREAQHQRLVRDALAARAAGRHRRPAGAAGTAGRWLATLVSGRRPVRGEHRHAVAGAAPVGTGPAAAGEGGSGAARQAFIPRPRRPLSRRS
jgi:hypothetical protein